MSKGKKLSITMAGALAETIDHGGQLVRREGGFWTKPGEPYNARGRAYDWYIGTNTVRALVDRGYFAETAWRTGHDGRYAIQVQIVTAALS